MDRPVVDAGFDAHICIANDARFCGKKGLKWCIHLFGTKLGARIMCGTCAPLALWTTSATVDNSRSSAASGEFMWSFFILRLYRFYNNYPEIG